MMITLRHECIPLFSLDVRCHIDVFLLQHHLPIHYPRPPTTTTTQEQLIQPPFNSPHININCALFLSCFPGPVKAAGVNNSWLFSLVKYLHHGSVWLRISIRTKVLGALSWEDRYRSWKSMELLMRSFANFITSLAGNEHSVRLHGRQ